MMTQGTMVDATIQLAIMLGAIVGGAMFDSSDYQATFGTSATLLIGAAVLTILASHSSERMICQV